MHLPTQFIACPISPLAGDTQCVGQRHEIARCAGMPTITFGNSGTVITCSGKISRIDRFKRPPSDFYTPKHPALCLVSFESIRSVLIGRF